MTQRLRLYPLDLEMAQRLDREYTYHEPIDNVQIERYVYLRAAARTLAEDIMTMAPRSREQSLALTKLEEAIMWANAAIARHEG